MDNGASAKGFVNARIKRDECSPELEFAHVVRLAPLVSIDLIIRNKEQKAFVALRTNEPATCAVVERTARHFLLSLNLRKKLW
jgi:hypothetical protein